MSTTFSLVVYVKPPHARPTSPSTIKITPSVLFTKPPSVATAGCRRRAPPQPVPLFLQSPNPQRKGLSARSRFNSSLLVLKGPHPWRTAASLLTESPNQVG